MCDWQVKSWSSWERRMSRAGAKGSWTAARWASTLLTTFKSLAPDVPTRSTAFPGKAIPSLDWSHWAVPAGPVWRSGGPASHRYIYTETTEKSSHHIYVIDRLENLGLWCLTHGFVRGYSAFFWKSQRDRNKAELQSYSTVTTLAKLITDFFFFAFLKGLVDLLFWGVKGLHLHYVRLLRVMLLFCTCEFQIYQKSIQVFISARSSWFFFFLSYKCMSPCTFIFSLTGLVLVDNWAACNYTSL